MAFCAKCGASLGEGAVFCASCGNQSGAASSSVGVPASPGLTAQSTGLTSNLAGALAYLAGFITGIIFLAMAPYNKDPFVRFHAFQSIFLSVAYIAVSIVWGTIFGLFFSTGLGFMWSLIALSLSLLRLAFLLVWLFMMYKAYNNERYMLPIIGPIAAKQAAA